MDLNLVDDIDAVKALFVVFLAGVVAGVLLYFYNTKLAPVFRGSLAGGTKSA